MQIYSLRPVDLSSLDWRSSSHKGSCLVNAADERAARAAATLAFCQAVEAEASASHPVNPWTNPEAVECREVGHMTGPMPPENVVFIPVEKGT